jgi:hypothetical protein
MAVLSTIQGRRAGLRAKTIYVSGQLPSSSYRMMKGIGKISWNYVYY